MDDSSQPLATDRPGLLVRDLRALIDRSRNGGSHNLAFRLDLGRALFGQSRFAEAADELQALVREPGLTEYQRTSANALLAGALALSNRPAGEVRQAAEAALSSPAADAESEVLARSALRGLLFFEGRYEEALEHSRVIAAIGRDAGPVGRGEAMLDMAGMLYHADRFDEAEAWYTHDGDTPARQRLEAAEHFAAMNLARGAWQRVLDDLSAAPIDDHDRPDFTRAVRPALRAIAMIHLGRPEQAGRELGKSTVRQEVFSLTATAMLAELGGDLATVGAAVERAAARMDPRWRPQIRRWGTDLVRLAIAGGDRTSASRLTEELEAATAVTQIPSVHGAAALARGMLERDPDLLTRAVDLFGQGPRRVAHAQAKEALGGALASLGRSVEAVAALRDSLAMWEAMDAEGDARRVRLVMAELGVRTRPVRRATERIGWAALSPTEATVAALLGEGLTNAQIADRLVLSTRTVETHVAHVLAKLDVPSRAAVARLVAERTNRPSA